MEIILGFSLALNGVFIGLWVMGYFIDKREKKFVQKHIEGLTEKYIERFKEYYA